MKYVHHIWITVHCKPEDDQDKIVEVLRKMVPFNLEENKVKIERDTVTSIEERKIVVFRIHLEKTNHINKFLSNLHSILNEDQIQLLLRQKESRLDGSNHFFLRFDKNRLIEKNEYYITHYGNCYHIKMSIAAFPTTRENALNVVHKILESNIK